MNTCILEPQTLAWEPNPDALPSNAGASRKLGAACPPALHQDIRDAARDLASRVHGEDAFDARRRMMFEARYGLFDRESTPSQKKITFQEVARRFGVTRQGVHAVVSRMLKERDLVPLHGRKPEGFIALSEALLTQDALGVAEQLGDIPLKTAAAFYRDAYGLILPVKQAVTKETDALKHLRRTLQRLTENNGAASLGDMAKMMGISEDAVAELLHHAQEVAGGAQGTSMDPANPLMLDGMTEFSPGWYALDSLKKIPWRNRFINIAQKMVEGARRAGVVALELDVIIQAVMRVPSSRGRADADGRGMLSPTLRVKLPREVARAVLLHYGDGLFLVTQEDDCTFVTFNDDRLAQGDVPSGLTDCERAGIDLLVQHGGRLPYRALHDLLVNQGFGAPLVGKVLQYSVLFRILDRAIRGFAWDDAFTDGT